MLGLKGEGGRRKCRWCVVSSSHHDQSFH